MRSDGRTKGRRFLGVTVGVHFFSFFLPRRRAPKGISLLPSRPEIFTRPPTCSLDRPEYWFSGMGVEWRNDEDIVQMEEREGEAGRMMISVNCPDKIGLGCDLSRILLQFGLSISRSDVSTDGKWCYVVFWVIPHLWTTMRWASLKNRLLSVCPSCTVSYYYQREPSPSRVYLLKVFCLNRKELLHDVTQVLAELEFTIHRVKVLTTPDGRVMDLFFITDGMELLHTKRRQDETMERLNAILGESCITCELHSVGPEYENFQQGLSSLSPAVAEELFSLELSENEKYSQTLALDSSKLKKANITLDNSLSRGHTLLQINCVDQKGLLYDIMRTLKDCSIQVSYGRFSSNTKGYREVDLFVQQIDGKKIVDPEKQSALSSRLRLEILHPLRVTIANRGPDTELLVANPVEVCGKGRPRVFHDVTLALKLLGICIFSAEIGRHSTSDRQWEVYRFLLEETYKFPLANSQARKQILAGVRKTLMGW